ncbi:hypothetical protein NIES2130_23185 [Scytonema sp. HK-05]|nr:hypothetical protein NIES2130_23185 [Scytonema sp. HK-05]
MQVTGVGVPPVEASGVRGLERGQPLLLRRRYANGEVKSQKLKVKSKNPINKFRGLSQRTP